MAFKLYSTDDGHVPAWEYHTIASGTKVAVGTGMAFDENGKLVASTLPTHICMVETADPKTGIAADMIGSVVRIAPDQIWESALYTDVSAGVKVGSKVDIASNPVYVDGVNSTNANFEITYAAGSLIGDVVRGRFVK